MLCMTQHHQHFTAQQLHSLSSNTTEVLQGTKNSNTRHHCKVAEATLVNVKVILPVLKVRQEARGISRVIWGNTAFLALGKWEVWLFSCSLNKYIHEMIYLLTLLFSIIWILRKLSHNSFFNGIDMDKGDIVKIKQNWISGGLISWYIFKFTTSHWKRKNLKIRRMMDSYFNKLNKRCAEFH